MLRIAHAGLLIALAVAATACARPAEQAVEPAATTAPGPASSPAPDARPNVIVIVADDLGFGDIGANGGTVIATPNIDALAQAGIRFTSGYVTAAVCAPSRAALFTGRHQQTFAYEYNPRARRDVGVPPDVRMIPDMLRESGYRTGLVGKWHLGETPEHHPLNRGFDEFFGFVAGGNGYLHEPGAGDEWMDNPVPGSRPGFQAMVLERGFDQLPPQPGYLTDILSREAVDFIERNHGQPFFLAVTHFAPHTPLQATASYLARYAHIEDQTIRIYAAMVSALDDSVGAIVDALERHGLEERTLVVFTSDNGCAAYIGEGKCSNLPFNGAKGTYFEGGIRVPMIAAWPGRLPAGSVIDEPVASFDWTVSTLGLAGLPWRDQGYDGMNLMPWLTDGGAAPREGMRWRTSPNYAIRDGDWKLINLERADGQGFRQLLFNLADDPGETRDLSTAEPDVVARLEAVYATWKNTLPEPTHDSQRQGTLVLPDGVEVKLYN